MESSSRSSSSESTSSSGSSSIDSISCSSDSVCIDVGGVPWGGQYHAVSTSHGTISVVVCGDHDKPALLTYPDLGLDTVSCFEGLMSEAAALIFHNFCVYHIDAPGHEFGAPPLPSDLRVPSVDDLADQVAEVCDYFGLQEVICMGVTAGAYILALFAMKYRERVLGLILISPLCRSPTWSEWLYDKAMLNLLYFLGMCGIVREALLQRYFNQDTLLRMESGIQMTFDRVLDERQSKNVMHFWKALHQRKDITAGLRNLRCRTLIFVGEHSTFYHEALHINRQMEGHSALVELQACGSLVTDEQPQSMLVPLEYYFKSFGFCKPSPSTSPNSTPTSPLSPPCIPPDLLSPESLGLKLKPIRTKVMVDET